MKNGERGTENEKRQTANGLLFILRSPFPVLHSSFPPSRRSPKYSGERLAGDRTQLRRLAPAANASYGWGKGQSPERLGVLGLLIFQSAGGGVGPRPTTGAAAAVGHPGLMSRPASAPPRRLTTSATRW